MANNLRRVLQEIEFEQHCIADAIPDAELAAMNEIYGLVKSRVFDKDKHITTELNSFGGYKSGAYKQKRKLAGLPTETKTLIFKGDLIKDFSIGESNGKVAVGFNNYQLNEIRIFQEESDVQINEPIFSPNEEEVEFGFEEYEKVIQKCLV